MIIYQKKYMGIFMLGPTAPHPAKRAFIPACVAAGATLTD
jgi:hypothetical protein